MHIVSAYIEAPEIQVQLNWILINEFRSQILGLRFFLRATDDENKYRPLNMNITFFFGAGDIREGRGYHNQIVTSTGEFQLLDYNPKK